MRHRWIEPSSEEDAPSACRPISYWLTDRSQVLPLYLVKFDLPAAPSLLQPMAANAASHFSTALAVRLPLPLLQRRPSLVVALGGNRVEPHRGESCNRRIVTEYMGRRRGPCCMSYGGKEEGRA